MSVGEEVGASRALSGWQIALDSVALLVAALWWFIGVFVLIACGAENVESVPIVCKPGYQSAYLPLHSAQGIEVLLFTVAGWISGRRWVTYVGWAIWIAAAVAIRAVYFREVPVG